NPSWSESNFYLDDDDTPYDSGWLVPGTYSVDELGVTGWDLTSVTKNGSAFTDATNFTLGAGETITLVYTNTQRGKIIVEKQTDPDGVADSFEFDPSWSGSNFFLTDGQQNDSGWLVPGTYTVSELVPTGWNLSSITGADSTSDSTATVILSPGETVTVVFNNQIGYLAYTPGFWKNHATGKHNAWQYTAFDKDTDLSDVFTIPAAYKIKNKWLGDYTLLGALSFQGGGDLSGAAQILLRAGVAALLNASFHELNPGLPYLGDLADDYDTPEEVIALVNAALASEDRGTMLTLADTLDDLNNATDYFDWRWPLP
ncbi:MAG: hypothetical protein QUS33_07665, partial [Dehalococcoidia bacterium]|nr:hypothetical protein [Dehalococcoidia bacterium]